MAVPEDEQTKKPTTSPDDASAEVAGTPAAVQPPTRSSFPIVGIGASAGGLAAFQAFFSGLPSAAPPMAFVLVQHQAPEHKSMLAEIIRRLTPMDVLEVEDGMRVQPGRVYIMPPNRDMAILNGRLHLFPPTEARGQRLPINIFFRSLAQDQKENAIGIVLAGTGTDGTLGIRAIKAEGGLVMAQTVSSTEFDGMPRSAIATGLIDFQLPPAEMPARLIAYSTNARRGLLKHTAAASPGNQNAWRKIFAALRVQIGHDFSQYKPSTLHRRLERRMALHQIETMDAYVTYLQQAAEEVEALYRDLLIGVTSFFRDQACPNVFRRESAGCRPDPILRGSEYAKVLYPAVFSRIG